jgi:Pyruvate/2-oxoacid:ferredoxin oxidoreductase delta subunit
MNKTSRTLITILGTATTLLAAFVLVAERGRLLRRSTLRMMQEGGAQRLRDRTFLHTYLYARWPREYIGFALRYMLPRYDDAARQGAANAYHGKVLPTPLAKRLVSVQRDIPLRDVERVLPYPVARNLVLQGPPDIVAFECPCRGTRPNPCQPTQVCMIVGQPFTDFVLEHHPTRSRRLTTAEAVDLLEAEHQRGHVHAAYFKDAMLNRFYAICNCCRCCCGGIEAMTQRHVPMMTASGFVAQVDTTRCAACGNCERACAFDAVHVNREVGHAEVDWQACMGCGVCDGQCSRDAIHLVRDERKGIPLDVSVMV